MDNEHVLTPFFLDSPAPLLRSLAGPGWRVNEPALPDADQRTRIGAIHRPLAERVRAVAAAGRRPVSVGGDCLQTAAVLAGLRGAGIDPVLLWLDAHGDFNTPETSPSGFIGGMPLAMLVGRGEGWLLENLALETLAERDVVLSDARDLDPGEAASLAASEVARVRVDEIVARLPAGRPIYVHFDPDVIDVQDAPAMLYPVPGGPSVDDLCRLAAALHRTHDIVAVSLTVWDMDRDGDGRTARACQGVLDALVAG